MERFDEYYCRHTILMAAEAYAPLLRGSEVDPAVFVGYLLDHPELIGLPVDVVLENSGGAWGGRAGGWRDWMRSWLPGGGEADARVQGHRAMTQANQFGLQKQKDLNKLYRQYQQQYNNDPNWMNRPELGNDPVAYQARQDKSKGFTQSGPNGQTYTGYGFNKGDVEKTARQYGLDYQAQHAASKYNLTPPPQAIPVPKPAQTPQTQPAQSTPHGNWQQTFNQRLSGYDKRFSNVEKQLQDLLGRMPTPPPTQGTPKANRRKKNVLP